MNRQQVLNVEAGVLIREMTAELSRLREFADEMRVLRASAWLVLHGSESLFAEKQAAMAEFVDKSSAALTRLDEGGK